MGINIHDPLVQIKGTYPSFHSYSPSHPLPSHRIRLWLCRHMHDLVPPQASLVSLLVGRRMGFFLLTMVPHISSTIIPRIHILFSLLVQIAGVFMHVEKPSDLSRLNRIAAYYLIATTFYAVIWSARLSILFSIIRIDPDPVMRRRLGWLAGAFIAAIALFFTQLFWVCETMHNGWKNKPSPQCPLPKQVAICQLVCTSTFLSWR
jgi:hypothetical protein